MLLVAGWEILAGLRQAAATARPADWQAAAAAVRAEFQPGDLIAIAPAWADPLGRAELGDLMPLSMVGRADGRRYPRIFELSIRGAHHEDVAGLRPEWTRSFGPVRLARYSHKAVEVTYDLVEHFFELRSDGGHVERRTLEIDYRPRYGISADAGTAWQPTVLSWNEVPDAAWQGAQLVLWFGLHDYYQRKNARGPADVVVELDPRPGPDQGQGQGQGTLRVPMRVELERGMQSLVLALPQTPGRALHTLRIEISAASAPHHLIGIQGEIRR